MPAEGGLEPGTPVLPCASTPALNFAATRASKCRMDTFLQDLRYAARTLVKNPGFAALTIACLALGIGVNSTIFSVVDTVAIRPLPFREPERLVSLATTHQANGIRARQRVVPRSAGLEGRTRAFAEIAAVSGRSLTLSDGDEPERFNGATVTWNMFPMLGIQPILGRQIRAEEDTPGGPRVVLLSHGVWQRRYAADPSIIGRTITVNGNPHTVIGVMPPRFQFPERAQLWIPQVPIEHAEPALGAQPRASLARLKPGVVVRGGRRDIAARRRRSCPSSSGTIRAGARRRSRCAIRLMPSDITADRDDDDGRGQPGAADRVRQRRQPAAGARDRPSAGNRRALGARRRTRPHRPAAADRERADRAGRARRSASPSPTSACSG